MPKKKWTWCQKAPKMDAEIDDKSMWFRNLRFLCFCREYNVKIVFLHEQGYQKSTKNPSKIDAKTRMEKTMPKLRKSEPKGSRNGAQNASKMPKRGQGGAKGPPKCQKKGMPKMMPKFDAENPPTHGVSNPLWGEVSSPYPLRPGPLAAEVCPQSA